MGYHRAGFDVVGVDIVPQPHYPFEFHQLDAIAMCQDRLNGCWHEAHYLSELPGMSEVCLGRFDAIHASPPCKAHTALAAIHKRGHADLLTPTRDLLRSQSAPWVMENVPGAPMRNYITLCGTAFGLSDGDFELWRHRWFESAGFAWPTLLPPCAHRVKRYVGGVYGGGGAEPAKCKHGKQTTAAVRRRLMGIDWMTREEIAQAIPPAYTEFIGAHLLAAVRAAA